MKPASLLHRLVALLLLFCMSACATTTTGYKPGETWQQRDTRLQKDAQATVAQGKWLGTLGGAAGGAAVGFGLAAVIMLDEKLSGVPEQQVKENFARNAISLGVIFAAAGASWGYKKGELWGEDVVKRKQAYANEEDYLNAAIKQTRKRTEAARKMNDRLIGEIASLKKKAADLTKGKNATKEEVQKYENLVKAQKPAVKEAEGKVAGALATAERERAAAKSSAKLAELDKQIAELRTERHRIRQRSQEMDNLPSRIYLASN